MTTFQDLPPQSRRQVRESERGERAAAAAAAESASAAAASDADSSAADAPAVDTPAVDTSAVENAPADGASDTGSDSPAQQPELSDRDILDARLAAAQPPQVSTPTTGRRASRPVGQPTPEPEPLLYTTQARSGVPAYDGPQIVNRRTGRDGTSDAAPVGDSTPQFRVRDFSPEGRRSAAFPRSQSTAAPIPGEPAPAELDYRTQAGPGYAHLLNQGEPVLDESAEIPPADAAESDFTEAPADAHADEDADADAATGSETAAEIETETETVADTENTEADAAAVAPVTLGETPLAPFDFLPSAEAAPEQLPAAGAYPESSSFPASAPFPTARATDAESAAGSSSASTASAASPERTLTRRELRAMRARADAEAAAAAEAPADQDAAEVQNANADQDATPDQDATGEMATAEVQDAPSEPDAPAEQDAPAEESPTDSEIGETAPEDGTPDASPEDAAPNDFVQSFDFGTADSADIAPEQADTPEPVAPIIQDVPFGRRAARRAAAAQQATNADASVQKSDLSWLGQAPITASFAAVPGLTDETAVETAVETAEETAGEPANGESQDAAADSDDTIDEIVYTEPATLDDLIADANEAVDKSEADESGETAAAIEADAVATGWEVPVIGIDSDDAAPAEHPVDDSSPLGDGDGEGNDDGEPVESPARAASRQWPFGVTTPLAEEASEPAPDETAATGPSAVEPVEPEPESEPEPEPAEPEPSAPIDEAPAFVVPPALIEPEASPQRDAPIDALAHLFAPQAPTNDTDTALPSWAVAQPAEPQVAEPVSTQSESTELPPQPEPAQSFQFFAPEPPAAETTGRGEASGSPAEGQGLLTPAFVEPPAARDYQPPAGHWSRQADLDDEEQPFENTLSRQVGGGNVATTTSALILPSVPQQPEFTTSLTSTGEIMVTGTIDLPQSFGSMGADSRRYDDPDVDHIFDAYDNEVVSTDSAPVRATRAVSTHTSNHGVIHSNKPKGNRMLTVLLISACGLAVGVFALLAVYVLNRG